MNSQKYYLGLDIGVGSLGWALIDADGQGIIDAGAIVYPSAQTNAERRMKRSQRHFYQSRKKRLNELKSLLESHFGDLSKLDTRKKENAPCIKKDAEENDAQMSAIYRRSKALDEKVELHHLAKAIYHIAKNRGVRLKRVTATDNDAESDSAKERKKEIGAQKDKAKKTSFELKKYGGMPAKLLESRRKEGLSVTAKPHTDSVLFTRDDMQNELQAILNKQTEFYDILKGDLSREIFDAVFPKEPTPDYKELIGKCCYNPDDERRLPKSSLLFQEMRIFAELNNIILRSSSGQLLDNDGKLTIEQRNSLYNALQTKAEIKGKHIKEILKLDDSVRVSIDNEGKKRSTKPSKSERSIKANETLRQFKNLKIWEDLNEDEKENLVTEISLNEDEAKLKEFLTNEPYGLSDKEAEKVMALSEKLPAGYHKAGKTATQQIKDLMQSKVISRYHAEEDLGLEHYKGKRDGEAIDRLPYYAELEHLQPWCSKAGKGGTDNEQKHGKIPNPVVHKSLNVIRKQVNAIIKEYGKPDEIHIEYARQLKMSEQEREIYERKMNKNKKDNEKARESGVKPLAMKLHAFQKGICPYTLKTITIDDIINGDAEIDHILPFAQTGWDAIINKVLCMTDANREKGNRSPYDAFKNGYKGGEPSYDQILAGIKDYPEAKQRLFNPEALEERIKKMPERFKTDTGYIAKLTQAYLQVLFNEKESSNIKIIGGGITHFLRHLWGLDSILQDAEEDDPKKNRNDSRHHVIDAICVAIASHKDVQSVNNFRKKCGSWEEYNKAIKKSRKEGLDNLWPAPWEGFRYDIKEFIKNHGNKPNLVVQKKTPDLRGALHKDSNYRGILYSQKDNKYLIAKRHSIMDVMVENFTGDIDSLYRLFNCTSEDENKIIKNITEDSIILINKPENYKKDDSEYIENYIRYDFKLRRELCETIMKEFENTSMIPETEEKLSEAKTDAEKAKVQNSGKKERLKIALENIIKRPHSAGKINSETNANLPPPTLKHFNIFETSSSARIIGKEEFIQGKKPSRLYITKNNEQLDIFYNTVAKKHDWFVVQSIDAAQGNKYIPEWKKDISNKECCSLKRNDELELEIDGEKVIARLQSISKGDILFIPVHRTETGKTDEPSIRISSIRKFKEYSPSLIYRNELGNIKRRSPVFKE